MGGGSESLNVAVFAQGMAIAFLRVAATIPILVPHRVASIGPNHLQLAIVQADGRLREPFPRLLWSMAP